MVIYTCVCVRVCVCACVRVCVCVCVQGRAWQFYGEAADMGSPHSAFVMATYFALNASAVAAGCGEGGGGEGGGGGGVEDEIGLALYREAAKRGSELALLAIGRRYYEASGAGQIQGHRNEEQCQAAFEWYRAAADLAVQAIQKSGGADAETEQVCVCVCVCYVYLVG